MVLLINGICTATLARVTVNLSNLQFMFKSGFTFTVPLDKIKQSIAKNEDKLKQLDRAEIMRTNIKFMKRSADVFKSIINERQISEWNAEYCSVCGRPVILTFNNDGVDVNNTCVCHNVNLMMKHMTYDDFAIWYASEPIDNTRKYHDSFWFSKEENNNE